MGREGKQGQYLDKGPPKKIPWRKAMVNHLCFSLYTNSQWTNDASSGMMKTLYVSWHGINSLRFGRWIQER